MKVIATDLPRRENGGERWGVRRTFAQTVSDLVPAGFLVTSRQIWQLRLVGSGRGTAEYP